MVDEKMIEQLIETAQAAGRKILTYYVEEIQIEKKVDESPLTQADLASHDVIVDALAEVDPETPVISEEDFIPSYDKRQKWDKFWLVDPLDGTKEFIKKNGEFTVNIALIDHGEPVIGVIFIPAKDRTYYAQKGVGSFRMNGNKEPKRIYSTAADKSKPLDAAASRSHQSETLENDLAKMDIELGELTSAGSSLKFCLVAEGTVDIYPRMKPTMEWDVAAGDCIYRNSAQQGQHDSPLIYNKEDLTNEGFIVGL